MIYWAHLIGSFLLRFVPPRVGYLVASVLGPLVAACWPGQYRSAWENMARVLGPSADPTEVSRRVREMFRNYGKYVVDLLWMPRASLHDLERNFHIVGLDHVEQAINRGNGLVMVTAHLGNSDLGAAILAHKGFAVSAIVETLRPLRWNERVQRIREQVGVQAIPLEDGARDMFAALRANHILGVLIDRPLVKEGVPVRFFDAMTRVPEGAARLAMRTGAGVVAVGVVRRGRRFVAHVSPLLDVEPSGDRARDAQELTQRAVDWLESVIRQHPDQWFMFRDMWPKEA